jgi:sorting nexin-29
VYRNICFRPTKRNMGNEIPVEWNSAIIRPIHKKDDRMVCQNYRGISLLNVTYKIMSRIIAYRLTPYTEEIIGDYQCGFRRIKSTVDHIFVIRNTLEKCYEYNITLHQLFIDFKHAYDSVWRDQLFDAMR